MISGLISIIGPVGAGKTTLADALAERLGGRVIYEDYSGNPFLTGKSEAGESAALASQLFFLNSRVAQLNRAHWTGGELVISDYGYCQDRIFAELKLCGDDLRTYEYMAARLSKYVQPPSLVIHLDAPVELLLERIKARGRDFEANFSAEFLAQLRRKQFDAILPDGCEKILIDCAAVDLRQTNSLDELVNKIRKI